MVWEVTEKVKVMILGEELEFDSKPTAVELIGIAKEKGLKRFVVKVNGVEISSPEQYDEVENVEVVEIIPYDEWGNQ